MNMVVPDRNRLGLVFQDFDAQSVRCCDPGLIGSFISELNRNARRFSTLARECSQFLLNAKLWFGSHAIS